MHWKFQPSAFGASSIGACSIKQPRTTLISSGIDSLILSKSLLKSWVMNAVIASLIISLIIGAL